MDSEARQHIVKLHELLNDQAEITRSALTDHRQQLEELRATLIPKLQGHLEAVTAQQGRMYNQLVANAEVLRQNIEVNTFQIEKLRKALSDVVDAPE